MKGFGKLGRVLLASTAVMALAGPATVGMGENGLAFIQPASAASVQIDFFYDRLSPHGSWVNHRRHGYVFVPAVGSGWRPYTRGHWVYTDAYGWYWESEEEFAWATYHYGRWGYDPSFGWYWVPGNVWGPAWVTWRYGGGNVGWAPIGPGDREGYVYGTPEYYEPPVVEAWVFVPERRMVAVDVARYVSPVVEVNLFLGKAREHHHVRYRDGRAYNEFLPRERVTKIVNKEVNIYNITNVNSPDETRRRGGRDRDGDRNSRQIQAFRAEVADTQPKEKPKRVANSVEEIKSPPKLKQTAKGKRPDDAPPSVAELKKEDNVAKPGDGDREKAEGKDRKAGDRDGKDRDNARRDGDRNGKRDRSESAERKQDGDSAKSSEQKGGEQKSNKADDEKSKKAERKQENEKSGKRGDVEKKAKQDGDAQKARQAERKDDAGKDDAKAKSDAKPGQGARDRAEPKPDKQKQKQAKPEREPQQKQKQAKPDREPKQKESKPDRQREAPPQRESRNGNAPQGNPEARQGKRQGPQQAEKQARPNKKQQGQRGEGDQGGGEQKERGGPNR